MLNGFRKLLNKRPMVTQMVASGFIGLTGDAICQFGIEKKKLKEYDLQRGTRFFLIPALLITPVLARWFRILERVPGSPKTVPLKRVFVDQLCGAPIFNGLFCYSFMFWENLDVKQSWENLKNIYLDVLLKSYQFWPFVQLVNFYFIPISLRVIVVQLASILWNCFISYKTQQAKKLT